MALAGIGLADDRLGQRGESDLSIRQVALIQAEHLPVIAGLARADPGDQIGLRRNRVVSDINLLALKNAKLKVSTALLEIAVSVRQSHLERRVGAKDARVHLNFWWTRGHYRSTSLGRSSAPAASQR